MIVGLHVDVHAEEREAVAKLTLCAVRHIDFGRERRNTARWTARKIVVCPPLFP